MYSDFNEFFVLCLRGWQYTKMAHQLAPSVNCSLDDIDLNALKVNKYSIVKQTFESTIITLIAVRVCTPEFLIARYLCPSHAAGAQLRVWFMFTGVILRAVWQIREFMILISIIMMNWRLFQDPAGIFELIEVVGNGTYGQVYKVSKMFFLCIVCVGFILPTSLWEN